MLEYSLIKQYRPRFNVRLVDDKSYPFLAVTVGDEWPRPDGHAGRQAQGGPLLRPLRPRLRHPRDARPAAAHLPAAHVLGQQVRAAPQAGQAVPAVPHREVQRAVRRRGRPGRLPGAGGRAARLPRRATPTPSSSGSRWRCARPPTSSSSSAPPGCATGSRRSARPSSASRWWPSATRTSMSSASPTTTSRLRSRCSTSAGDGSWVARASCSTRSRTSTPGELVGNVLEGLYYDPPPMGIPKQVLVPTDPDDVDLYERWLGEQRGSNVAVRVPQRGDKRRLQETVTHNAGEELTRHRLKRAADHNSRAKALNELQEHLGLPEPPLRIECYDMSHLQGTDYVGSMVVLDDGLPKKCEYRRFKIRRPRQRRLRRHGGGPHPAVHATTWRSGPSRCRSGASSPTRRSCCWSTAARASSAWRCGCSKTWASTRRSRWRRWPSASRRSTCPARATR